ncbi:MAG: glycosyltransferase family 4 protein [Ilumatobacteraceae bacterium]
MLPRSAPTVMGFYFSPRGGSAQVARYLCRSLGTSEWSPMLFSGSQSGSADTDAAQFFAGTECRSLDYSPAIAEWRDGFDPMKSDRPVHASYEDKAGVPDRIFFDLDDAAYDHQVSSWRRHFAAPNIEPPCVIHLHHLTPMHEAVRLLWPDVPVITHLHGTDLKMLAAAVEPGAVIPGRWTKPWVRRMRRWASASARVVTVSSHDADLAQDLFPEIIGLVRVIGNGVDTEVFQPRRRSADQCRAAWQRWLVDEPLGWSPNGGPGSLRYSSDDLDAFVDEQGEAVPVVLFAGRFMEFKRLSLLIEAHHQARTQSGARAVLVIVGGFPGEWEGEHPVDTVARLGAKDVFFAGWRSHSELAEFLACVDVFAAPSFNEPFGLVYLEAMAAGVPPIATNVGGPPTFINTIEGAPNGWLIEPDDLAALTSVLIEAASERGDRAIRGANARSFVNDHSSWSRIATDFTDLYAEVVAEFADTPSKGVA